MLTTTPPIKLGDLTRQQRIEQILTTTSTRHVDALEREFIGQVHVLPLLRNSLFEAARQQARYRQQQLPRAAVSKPMSEREAYGIHALKVPELIGLLQTTTDPRVVDEIEECTIERLASLLTVRKALFTVARQRAESRAEQAKAARSSQPNALPSRTA